MADAEQDGVMNSGIRDHARATVRRLAGAWARSERMVQQLDNSRASVKDRPRWSDQQSACRYYERRR
jgi:hypothetical protein